MTGDLELLQNWLEVSGSGAIEVAQSGTRWLNLEGHHSVTFWLEVRLSENAELLLHYDTAPVIDPTLFQSMAAVVMRPSPHAVVTKVLLSQSPPTPLAGLVRWRIESKTESDWRVMFRVRCSPKGRQGMIGRVPVAL